tara:strand:+ start:517 stop:1131 length:615 start_codon:yes stop_codon:yes gene_type:complete
MKQLVRLLMCIPLLSFSFATVFDVEISGFTFLPNVLEVQVGDTVKWTNNDSSPHTATALDDSWDTGTLNQGESFMIQFGMEGSFDYDCTFHSSMTGTITVAAMEIDQPNTLTESFQLHPNYPNPFNPSTRITFSTDNIVDVFLTVYSVSGLKVKELGYGSYMQGTHTVSWNGRDEKNRSVSTGVYILKVKAGEQVLTRKMTLIK